MVLEPLPLITLLDERVDIATLTVKNVRVETTITSHLRVYLTHKFLPLFKTHVYH